MASQGNQYARQNGVVQNGYGNMNGMNGHQSNGMNRPIPQRRPVRRTSLPNNQPIRKTQGPKAHSASGDNPSNVTSAYAIMANRIANRVAEMAESITFVERPQPQQQFQQQQMMSEDPNDKKRPRKLEMRLPTSGADSVSFSAPFLDNTLQKMLALQNRMLKSTADLSKTEGVDEKVIREQAAQSAELSRIIALICAEKARQGA